MILLIIFILLSVNTRIYATDSTLVQLHHSKQKVSKLAAEFEKIVRKTKFNFTAKERRFKTIVVAIISFSIWLSSLSFMYYFIKRCKE